MGKTVNQKVVELLGEVDPDGKDPKTGGAKLDNGKSPVSQGVLQYFPRALCEVANLSGAGAAKYSWKGWETVEDGINRYNNALSRHQLYEAIEGLYDDQPGGTGLLHATAVAWNALAALELLLRELERNDQPTQVEVSRPLLGDG